MNYFTDSVFERMMRMPPDKSERPVRRNRREMMQEYEFNNEKKAAEEIPDITENSAEEVEK